MIFEINSKKDPFIEDIYEKSMKELNDFFGINWVKKKPSVIIVPDRRTINKLKNEKTEDWVIAWAGMGDHSIYLLDRKNYEKESCHKYSDEKYSSTIKHELAHLFLEIFCKYSYVKPMWLNEGVCIYLSGQNNFKKKPDKFGNFLDFYDKGGKEIYSESGFAVQVLIEKHGKEKFMKLLEGLKDLNSKEKFEKIFYEIYRFKPYYEEFNKLL